MAKLTDHQLQARVQAASDALADALSAGDDSTVARKELDDARAALEAHQATIAAAEREREAAHAAEADQAAAVASIKAVQTVIDTTAQVHLPEGMPAPAPQHHPLVAKAADEVARLHLAIQRGAPERQQAADEVAALQSRAAAKRQAAAAIKSRRMAGHEQPDDVGQLHLLESDAADLDQLVQVAQLRQQALDHPVAGMHQQLDAAEKKLREAQVDGALHGQGDRLRVLEQALIAGYRELRRSAMDRGRVNVPTYFIAHPDLRRLSYGQGV